MGFLLQILTTKANRDGSPNGATDDKQRGDPLAPQHYQDFSKGLP